MKYDILPLGSSLYTNEKNKSKKVPSLRISSRLFSQVKKEIMWILGNPACKLTDTDSIPH